MISWQVDLVRVGLVAIDLVRIDLVTPSHLVVDYTLGTLQVLVHIVIVNCVKIFAEPTAKI